MSRTICWSVLGFLWVCFETRLSKPIVFSPQERDSYVWRCIFFMLSSTVFGVLQRIFCHWSNGFCLVPIAPPHFPWARARLWNTWSWPEFFGFAPRCWCDDSYGAAHRRFSSDQKYLKNQLYFNSFDLQRVVGNITCILVAGFSFIFDMTFFLINLRKSIFHCFLLVQMLGCFDWVASIYWRLLLSA